MCIRDRCSNASGTHKLPLVVIGKAQKPCGIMNMNVSSFPICYRGQKPAWMNKCIFKDWLINEFIFNVKKTLKRKCQSKRF